jgi:hypothetical protein
VSIFFRPQMAPPADSTPLLALRSRLLRLQSLRPSAPGPQCPTDPAEFWAELEGCMEGIDAVLPILEETADGLSSVPSAATSRGSSVTSPGSRTTSFQLLVAAERHLNDPEAPRGDSPANGSADESPTEAPKGEVPRGGPEPRRAPPASLALPRPYRPCRSTVVSRSADPISPRGRGSRPLDPEDEMYSTAPVRRAHDRPAFLPPLDPGTPPLSFASVLNAKGDPHRLPFCPAPWETQSPLDTKTPTTAVSPLRG